MSLKGGTQIRVASASKQAHMFARNSANVIASSLIRASREHKKRTTVLVAVALVAIVAGSLLIKRQLGSGDAVATTRIVTVSSGTLAETVSASGTIAAAATENLNFEAGGQVTDVVVAAGERVKKGQVLAKIESAALASQVAQARASVASAESRLSSDQDAGASSAQLAADEASLAAAESDLAVAKASLGEATLRSPIKGMVAAVNLDEGQFVSAGSSTSGQSSSGGSAAAGSNSNASSSAASSSQIQVISVGSYVVDLNVDDTQISKISEGDQATITVTGASDNLFGTVSSIGLVASSSSGVASFPVQIKITGTQTGLYAGSAAQVAVTYHQIEDAIQVPSMAITQVDGASVVQLVREGGTEQREVTTGITASGTTQVVRGLAAGDQVQVTMPVAVGQSGNRSGGNSGGAGGSGGFPQMPSGGIPMAPPGGFSGSTSRTSQ